MVESEFGTGSLHFNFLQFGCNFWHWELEYVGYLISNNYIRGDAAVDALGWAEERREELELRKQEASMTRVQGKDLHDTDLRDPMGF